MCHSFPSIAICTMCLLCMDKTWNKTAPTVLLISGTDSFCLLAIPK